MTTFPTHALIDANTHMIGSITIAEPGSAHSHRVRFGCGVVFDVRGEHEFAEHAVGSSQATTPADATTALKSALAIASRVEQHGAIVSALMERDLRHDAMRRRSWLRRLFSRRARPVDPEELIKQSDAMKSIYAEYAQANIAYHAALPPSVHERWLTSSVAVPVKADCAVCRDIELGKRAAIAPAPRDTSKIRYPDIATGLMCPDCGTEIRLRRYSDGAACTGAGHEFTFPQVEQVAVGLIARLAKGELGPLVMHPAPVEVQTIEPSEVAKIDDDTKGG